MSVTAFEAIWFFPFVLPLCLYVAFTDMARMRIPNHAVVALLIVFLIVGLIVLPFDLYLWRLLGLGVVLVIGIALNAVGVIGAGDGKFAAAAAPFMALGDLRLLMALFTATLLAAVVTHRVAKYTPLRRLAPHWVSWDRSGKFPMGLALGATLALYLGLGIFLGA